jgi:hypothetical protein
LNSFFLFIGDLYMHGGKILFYFFNFITKEEEIVIY